MSVKDLLDAREAYHTHLLHLDNVIATAIGRYRFVKSDDDSPKQVDPAPGTRGRDDPRTLANSEVRSYSWPCVMVFVDRWIPKSEFGRLADEIVPPRLYLADGRVAPTCVILAEKQAQRIGEVQTLRFPDSMLGGGYPSLAEVQGQTRVATVGCLVSDGDTLYALTNAHVAGEAGRELYSLVRGRRELLGRTETGKRVTRIAFDQAYPGFCSPRSVVNLDAALVRVEDANRWTSQVFGIGEFDELADLNVDTVNLDLIGCNVVAFGAASGEMRGEINGLFYRYRSVGGQDQHADLLIGPRPPRTNAMSVVEGREDTEAVRAQMASQLGRHGNSGAIWFLEVHTADERVVYRPFGLHWGTQRFVDSGSQQATQHALASSLGVICRELGVEIVRDLNIGLPEVWGKVGHYKVGQLACRVSTELGLQRLLQRNESRISYKEDIDHDVASPSAKDAFIPLADVSDLVWKRGGQSVRGNEGPNHFADMDQPSPDYHDQNLLDLSNDPTFLDPEKWNDFYESIDVDMRHRGLLPFRVWQLFDEMVAAIHDESLARYVAAAGVLAHYVGDACQPLHVSMLHDGEENGRGKGVHSAYETKMLDRYAPDLNALIDELMADEQPDVSTTGVRTGEAAAREIIELMRRSIRAIPPAALIDTYEAKHHRIADLWAAYGEKTARRIFDGATVLASLWCGAWLAANGPQVFSVSQLRAVPQSHLRNLYLDKDWAPSVTLGKMSLKGKTLEVET